MAKKKTKLGIVVPTLSSLNKKYGHLLKDISEDIPLWLPSTLIAFTQQCGGGIPYGKIMEIMGEESSCKSLMSFDMAYCCQQLGGHVIWIDAEGAWSTKWAKENGLNLKQVTVIEERAIEDIADVTAELCIYYRSILTNNEPILLVMDSIAAMDTRDNLDSKMVDGKAEMGGRAKALYKMFRIRSALYQKLGITQIYINQLRTSLNVGFGKDNSTTTGGAALKYYASIRVAFYAGRKVEIKKKRAGKLITIRAIKNKVAPPGETISKCPVYFNPKYHEVGWERYYGLLDILVDEGVVKRKGSSVIYKGKSIARGEDSFMKLIEEDDALRRKLLRKLGVNTITVTEKLAESLSTNLFPIDGQVDYEKFDDVEYTDEDDRGEEEDEEEDD